MPRKLKLKPRTYHEVSDAVESAIRYGLNRAHKHTDKPELEDIIEQIRMAVMNEIAECVEFPHED